MSIHEVEILPFLPSYFKFVISNFELHADIINSFICVDFVHYEHSENRITKKVKPSFLWLLGQCLGTENKDSLIERTINEFPSESLLYLSETLEDFLLDRILLDARTDSDAAPCSKDSRYARHNSFYAAHGANSSEVAKKLNSSKIAIIGAGGVGTWVAYLLCAAGVGDILIIDGDTIELSNLTRQVLFTSDDIGRFKAEVAAERLRRINSSVKVDFINSFCDYSLLANRSMSLDLLIVSGDKPDSLYDDISQYTAENRVPWLRGGYFFDIGLVGPLIIPGITGCKDCLFDNNSKHMKAISSLPLIKELNDRYQVPSFGPLNGAVASFLAKEAIMFLGGLEKYCKTISASVIFDMLDGTTQHMKLSRSNISNCYCYDRSSS